jgi:O-acetyl-ADP-ribose deacetylase (regulator of RNase III)
MVKKGVRMKIMYKKGDLLQCSEGHLIHGCNAQGVMGAGVARLIRDDCPRLYEEYRVWCKAGGKLLGNIIWHRCETGRLKGKLVGNAITQEYFGSGGVDVSYDAIRQVMRRINEQCEENTHLISIAMPKIGAGLAGGDWDTIAQIIEQESSNFQPVVYEL